MKIQILIDGQPSELIQVLQLIDGSNLDTTSAAPEKAAPVKKSKKAEAPAEPSSTPEPESKPKPEAQAPAPAPTNGNQTPASVAGTQAPPQRLDLATIRKAFGERFTNEKRRDEVMAVLKSFGHDKVSVFYQNATDEEKEAFYQKITAIPLS